MSANQQRTADPSAAVYAEEKGIYAILEHLARAIISGTEEPTNNNNASSSLQHQNGSGLVRPKDPLAFLVAYTSSREGRAALEAAVHKYVTSRGKATNGNGNASKTSEPHDVVEVAEGDNS